MDKNHIKDLINKSNPIILDIGAYDGGDSLGFAHTFPAPIIHSFEADPRSQKLFRSRVNNSKITLHEHAIGNIDGEIEFYIADPEQEVGYHCSGSLNPPRSHLEFFPHVPFCNIPFKVPCKKLDTWYKTTFKYFPDIDFIWADVNGAEKDLILGGIETLQLRTKYLYTEFSNDELYAGQINKEEILHLLTNFRIIYEDYGDKGYGNVCLKNIRFL